MTGSGIRSIAFVISVIVEQVSVSTNEVKSDVTLTINKSILHYCLIYCTCVVIHGNIEIIVIDHSVAVIYWEL